MTVNSLTTGTGTIQFDQSGGGAVTYSTATTTTGSIVLTKAGADLTVGTGVSAGGAGNDVTLTTTAGGERVLHGHVHCAGPGHGDFGGQDQRSGTVTASTVDLNAATGIGDTTPLNLAATTITADTTGGNIDVNNALGTAVAVNTLTTGTGNIPFDQTGGGAVTYGTATTTNGTILLTGADGLTVGTSVSAGGTGRT